MRGVAVVAWFPLLAAALACRADEPATVREIAEVARRRSPRLLAATHARDAAVIDAGRERPVARPTLTAHAEGVVQGPRVSFPKAGGENATVQPETLYRLRLDLEQLLYRPGLGPAQTRYGASLRLADLERLKVECEVLRDVRKAFHDVLLAEAMNEVAADGVRMAKAQLDQTDKLIEAGLAPPRDRSAGEADLAEAEQGAVRAANGLALARAELGRLTGDPSVATRAIAAPVELPDPPGDIAGLVTDALARRPELQMASAGLEAARAGLALARLQRQPRLSARATVARQTGSAFVDPTYAAAGLALTWDLLDGGKSGADVAEAAARIAELEAQQTGGRAGIALEVEKAVRDMRDARARFSAAERQVAAAQVALEISRARYEEREAIQLEVSGALFALLRARGNVAHARHDLYAASADLQLASGADVPQSAGAAPEPARAR